MTHIARDVHAIGGPVGGCTLREAVDLQDGSLDEELVTLRTHNTNQPCAHAQHQLHNLQPDTARYMLRCCPDGHLLSLHQEAVYN